MWKPIDCSAIKDIIDIVNQESKYDILKIETLSELFPRVVVIGKTGTGKSSLLCALMQGDYLDNG